MRKKMNAYTLAFIGVMAAIVYVVTMFRFPLLGSKVHFANIPCFSDIEMEGSCCR